MPDEAEVPPPTEQKLPFELQGDERVVLFCRRHWLYFYTKLASVVLSLLLPTIVLIGLVHFTAGLGGTVGKVALIIAAAWVVFWAIRGYFTWYRYQNDVWVVTNQRIIDSTKYNWIKQRMASADLVDVEDINVVREGLFATMFNYGDLRVQTAGEVANFVLAGIPAPSKVLAVVDSSRDAARRQFRGALS
ncbi:MAG: PH domain-containing protein [Tepidiformaceae bacterium]